MRQLRRHARFPQKALFRFPVFGQLRWQHLEGDQPVEAFVAGEHHDAHTATAKFPLDFVLAAQGGSDRGDIAGGGISVQRHMRKVRRRTGFGYSQAVGSTKTGWPRSLRDHPVPLSDLRRSRCGTTCPYPASS